MRILGISGSLRRDSHNTKLLRAAEELLPAGVEFELYDELETVPPYNEDRDTDDSPFAAVRLRDAIAGADAVLFATPEYNGSVPGQLKNAVDWASRPHRVSALWGKPVAVVGASTGMFGAVWAQAELRKVLKTAGARVVESEVAVGKADSRFDPNDVLVDDEIREQLAETIELLLAEAAVQAEAAPTRLVAA
jgi:chromate reductase, NAD(P)H dehydrogenase (quinone)